MYEIIENNEFTIYRFLVENSDRNINYVLSCNTSKECIIIDPLDKFLPIDPIRLECKYL